MSDDLKSALQPWQKAVVDSGKYRAFVRSGLGSASFAAGLIDHMTSVLQSAKTKEFVADLTEDEAAAICFLAGIPYEVDAAICFLAGIPYEVDALTGRMRFEPCGIHKSRGE